VTIDEWGTDRVRSAPISTAGMTDDTRAEILARYRRHAARFARDAASRKRRRIVDAAPAQDAPARPPALPAELPRVQLSAREHEILELIAAGLTDAEIAKRVVLSEFTVKTHVKRLLTKLSARNRAHAVAIALHRGLFSLVV